jgi:ferredoxin
MVKRQIIKIDEDDCTGCGECIPNCPEGAIQIIDDKARIISDLFCDGLGACIGHCPVDAISIEEREAEPYDERRVMENVVKQGDNTIKAHLLHLKDHGQDEFLQTAIDYLKENDMKVPDLEGAPAAVPEEKPAEEPVHAHDGGETLPCGCPGSSVMDFRDTPECQAEPVIETGPAARGVSELKQWPVQIMLVPPSAPYLKDAEILIAADCVPFAYPNFHDDFLKGKVLLVGCPKLDDAAFYQEKITQIFKDNNIKSVTVVHMEVPCCFGMVKLVEDAIKASGKTIPFAETTITVKGEKKA